MNCLDRAQYEIYSDLEGFSTSAGGTIPPNICVTNLKPDLVIINNNRKTIHLFELTVPFETRIDAAHKLKEQKYSHFNTDITEYTPFVMPFEIGSRGFVTKENKETLKIIHKFCKKSIKFKTFLDNISAISASASYYIFLARKEPLWTDTAYISPPFQ